jgi:hypothetical protein
MRSSNRVRARIALAIVVATLAVGACAAAAAPSASPTARPTPVVTPDPHLANPASVDDLFRKLGAADVRITPNTATGFPGGDPVKRINATYANWPLVLTEFTSAEALVRIAKFDPARAPRRGESPYILAGMNLLIEYGPQVTNDPAPAPADAARRTALLALVAALDPLVGPLAQRSVDPLDLPVGTPLPGTSPATASAAP